MKDTCAAFIRYNYSKKSLLNSINKIKTFLTKKFKSYKPPTNVIKVSQNL